MTTLWGPRACSSFPFHERTLFSGHLDPEPEEGVKADVASLIGSTTDRWAVTEGQQKARRGFPTP